MTVGRPEEFQRKLPRRVVHQQVCRLKVGCPRAGSLHRHCWGRRTCCRRDRPVIVLRPGGRKAGQPPLWHDIRHLLPLGCHRFKGRDLRDAGAGISLRYDACSLSDGDEFRRCRLRPARRRHGFDRLWCRALRPRLTGIGSRHDIRGRARGIGCRPSQIRYRLWRRRLRHRDGRQLWHRDGRQCHRCLGTRSVQGGFRRRQNHVGRRWIRKLGIDGPDRRYDGEEM